MKFRKKLSLAMAVIFALTVLIAVVPAAAASMVLTPTLTTDKTSYSSGENLELTLNLSGFPDGLILNGFEYLLEYDRNLVELQNMALTGNQYSTAANLSTSWTQNGTFTMTDVTIDSKTYLKIGYAAGTSTASSAPFLKVKMKVKQASSSTPITFKITNDPASPIGGVVGATQYYYSLPTEGLTATANVYVTTPLQALIVEALGIPKGTVGSEETVAAVSSNLNVRTRAGFVKNVLTDPVNSSAAAAIYFPSITPASRIAAALTRYSELSTENKSMLNNAILAGGITADNTELTKLGSIVTTVNADVTGNPNNNDGFKLVMRMVLLASETSPIAKDLSTDTSLIDFDTSVIGTTTRVNEANQILDVIDTIKNKIAAYPGTTHLDKLMAYAKSIVNGSGKATEFKKFLLAMPTANGSLATVYSGVVTLGIEANVNVIVEGIASSTVTIKVFDAATTNFATATPIEVVTVAAGKATFQTINASTNYKFVAKAPYNLSRMVTGNLNTLANTLDFTGGVGNKLLAGDLNSDDQTTILDLSIFAANYNKQSGALPNQGDLNGDGKTTILDLSTFATNYNKKGATKQ